MSEPLPGISWENPREILVAEIDNRNKLGVAANAAVLDSAKRRHGSR
jgi:hypothetical protein